MRGVRRSCRSRKPRSRLSLSGRVHTYLAVNPVYSCGKRRSSRKDRSNAANLVAKELNFADLDGNCTPALSACRRRGDRLLQRMSLEKTPVLSTPTTPGLIPQRVGLKENIADGSTLEQIELVPGDNNEIVESMFGDVFDKASLLKVEVEQCVSLPELRVRPIHRFGIQRAVHILRGNSVGSVTGHVCVGKFPVIAELPKEYDERILQYLCSKGRDREAGKLFISSKTMYQLVNGGYEHEGRWCLIDASGYQFTGIKWRTVRIPWQDPKILRAISIMSSQVQKKELVVELSFADEIVHLRRIIEEHIMENAIVLQPGKPLPRGFCKEISKVYTGGKDYSNNTLRHLISIVSKMSMKTALLIRKVIDEECPDIANSIHRKSSCEDSPELIDTRVFRTLINSKSLRGAKAFFAHDKSDQDRQNALHRLRYIAQEKGRYKGVDHTNPDEQVEAAISGRKVIEAFRERILRKDTWPPAMKPLLRNILLTTKLDTEIAENMNKPDDLLTVLKHNYQECAGVEGGTRIEQYEKFVLDQARNVKEDAGTLPKQIGDKDSSPSVASRTPMTDALEGQTVEARDSDSPIDDGRQELGAPQSAASSENSEVDTSGTVDVPLSQQEHGGMDVEIDPEPEPALTPLEQCNIEVHGRTWEDYNKSVLNEQEAFDFVISYLFQKAAAALAPVIDEARRIELVQFVKKVLVPGGYVFLIVPQLQVAAWLEAFEELELKSEGIFTLLKDPEVFSVLRARVSNFLWKWQ